MEIECKYVLEQLPSIDMGEGVPMVQGYIPSPKHNVTIRPRQEGDRLVLTLKSIGLSVRHEKNIDLSDSPEIFALLVENTEGAIRKKRYAIPDGDHPIEVDVYEGDHPSLLGKITAEREFDSVEAMETWQPPQWMLDAGARNVTGQDAYMNSTLLKHGWPE
jgi:CYTH domain-containing protein